MSGVRKGGNLKFEISMHSPRVSNFDFRVSVPPNTWHLTPIPRRTFRVEQRHRRRRAPVHRRPQSATMPPRQTLTTAFPLWGFRTSCKPPCVVEEGTIFSKVVPQSRHLNSKSGIRTSCWEYSQTSAGLQSPTREFGWSSAGGLHRRCIFCGFFGCISAKMS